MPPENVGNENRINKPLLIFEESDPRRLSTKGLIFTAFLGPWRAENSKSLAIFEACKAHHDFRFVPEYEQCYLFSLRKRPMSDGKAGFARRLNDAFDRLDIPPKQRGRFTALARLFSVSPVAARDWCEGNSYPSVDKLLLIMDTVRCGADWLLFGRGREAAANDGAEEASAHRAGLSGPGSAGSADAVLRPPAAGAPLRWLEVHGDAMAPTLRAGEWVGYQPMIVGTLADGVHVLLPLASAHGEAGLPMLRRIQRQLDGILELSCDNPRYAERSAYSMGAAGRLSALAPGGPPVSVLGRVLERRGRLD
jgi:hypothetical protein